MAKIPFPLRLPCLATGEVNTMNEALKRITESDNIPDQVEREIIRDLNMSRSTKINIIDKNLLKLGFTVSDKVIRKYIRDHIGELVEPSK